MQSPVIGVLQAVVYAILPVQAWATSITLGETMASVPLLAWLAVILLSSISGLAALLSRLKEETPKALPTFVAAHMLGSLLAGMIAFFGAEASDQHDLIEAIIIALFAYAGAKLVDLLASKVMKRIEDRVA